MITQFRDDYRFLSNFWPAEVVLDGVAYPTVEHAYQAAKTLDKAQRQRVLACDTPGQAKRMGKNLTMRKDWDQVKIKVMRNLLMQKFSNADLAVKLLFTANEELIEGNTWGDKFWGAVWEAKANRWDGENNLGKLLMQIREELRNAI